MSCTLGDSRDRTVAPPHLFRSRDRMLPRRILKPPIRKRINGRRWNLLGMRQGISGDLVNSEMALKQSATPPSAPYTAVIYGPTANVRSGMNLTQRAIAGGGFDRTNAARV